MSKGPESGITTHPEVVRAAIKILKEIHCKIFVGDGPSVFGKYVENVDGVYEGSGIKRICQEEGVELVKFDKRRMYEKFPLAAWLDDCDYLVNLPKFKTHELTVLTGAIKNLFGLVPGTYKTELHKNYHDANEFAKIVVDIFELATPSLTIVDGIVAMEGDGPASAGKLRNTGLLLASSDCVALDAVLAKIMGLQPLDILTTREAARRGLGTPDISSISVVGEKLDEVTDKPFLLPTMTFRKRIPAPIMILAKKMVKYRPVVNHDLCIQCSACILACPKKVMSVKNNRVVINYRGCIACFCCLEVCPQAAIKVKKSLFARIIGL